MPQKTVWLPDIGEVILSKRKGAKNIRLSISAAGKVRVGLPAWAPYAAGINFAKSRGNWINQHLDTHKNNQIAQGSRIGKSYRVNYIYNPGASKTTARLSSQAVNITSHLPLNSPSVQSAAVKASERALKKEASQLLPGRLSQIANSHNFAFKDVRIKKLVSRWGSCSSDKRITLNYFLMQLPWELIDYVLTHELVHTRHLNHSPAFWTEFETINPSAKQIRKLIKQYRPVINSVA
jgi:predicted metal-dependent hydrolase